MSTSEVAVMHELTEAEAKALTRKIKSEAKTAYGHLEKLADLIHQAQEGKAWKVLGFKSWPAYLSDVFTEYPLLSKRPVRQELVGMMTAEGMSSRAQAEVLGVDQGTVLNDQERIAEEKSASGEPVPVDSVVIGKDGKVYSAKKPPQAAKPPQEPKPKPLNVLTRTVKTDLAELLDALDDLNADERFKAQRASIVAHLRPDVEKAMEALASFLA